MKKIWGALLVILSSVAYGAMPALARLAYADGMTPLTLLFLRFTSAAVLMAVILLVTRTPLPRGKLLLQVAALGAFGYVAQSLSYFTAITLASASLVALLMYLFPIIVTAVSVLVFHEPLTRANWAALGIALVGTVLTIGPGGSGKPLGIVLGVVNAVVYATYILVSSRLLKKVAALPATAVIISAAALVYSGLGAVEGFHFPASTIGWAAALALGIFSTVMAIGLFLAGLERIGPTATSTLAVIEPATVVVLSVLVMNESVAPARWIGGALILAAAVITARSSSGAEKKAASGMAAPGMAEPEKDADTSHP